MKTVKRNEDGQIVQVYDSNTNAWMSIENHTIYKNHVITEEEVASFFGEDDLLTILTQIANNEYPVENLRMDILIYNEIFNQ